MWLHVVAVEFTIERPQTTEGWIGLAVATLAVLWILAKGTKAFLNQALGKFLYPALGLFLFLGALVVFNYAYSGDSSEPVTRGEIEVLPDGTPAGVKAEVHPELDYHGYDGHDDYRGYDYDYDK